MPSALECSTRRLRSLDALHRHRDPRLERRLGGAPDALRATAPPAPSTPISAPSRAEERACALELLGWSLADRYEWKQAIRAYRASLALVDERLASAPPTSSIVAEHGFRIVDNTVEADAAAPRICLNFSDRLAPGRDYGDFVSVDGGTNLAIEGAGQQICIDGVEHGRRYHVTARAGIPAADGETLAKSVDLDIFVRDRAPSVRFLGNAYVLPAGGEPTIPVVTVNTNRVNATLFRIGDRQLADAIADGTFLSPALLLGDGRHRGEVGREGLGGHGRRRKATSTAR